MPLRPWRKELTHGFERRVGWFVLAGIAVLIAVLIALSVRTEIFARKLDLWVRPPSASGFFEGQPVRLQGFRVGWVDALGLDEQGAWVKLKVLARYQPLLKKPLVAQLEREGVIGEAFVALAPGKGPESVQDGEEITFEPETTLTRFLKSMEPVVETARQLLEDTAELVHWLNDPYGALKQSASHLAKASAALDRKQLARMLAQLEQTSRHLEKLTRELAKQDAGAHAAGALKAAEATLAGIAPLAKELGARSKPIAGHTETLLADLDALADLLNRISQDVATASPEFPGIARQTRASLEEMRKLLRELRASWLVGGGKEATSPQVIAPEVGQ